MLQQAYILDGYIKCGAMPLYLIFYRSRQGYTMHYAMLCNTVKLKKLLRQKKKVADPEEYGRVVYFGREAEPTEALKSMLRHRYYFDFDQAMEGKKRFL